MGNGFTKHPIINDFFAVSIHRVFPPV